ncbi:MAG: hypothetical protein C0594_13045 [Marinilabiliales bacterium]|nr:MAG: hypothetical protein C0594_13045 [Marinilabiliales bacterium]
MNDKSKILFYVGLIMSALSILSIVLAFTIERVIFSWLMILTGIGGSVLLLLWLKHQKTNQQVSNQKKQENKKVKDSNVEEETEFKHDEALLNKLLHNISKDLSKEQLSENILRNLNEVLNVRQSIIFVRNGNEFLPLHHNNILTFEEIESFNLGEGLHGQVVASGELLVMEDLRDEYLTIIEGKEELHPNVLILVPIVKESESVGVVELASFNKYDKVQQATLRKLGERLGQYIN